MGTKLGVFFTVLVLVGSACGGGDDAATTSTASPIEGTKPATSVSTSVSEGGSEETVAPTAKPGFPRVYRGQGLYHLTIYRSGDDATFTCEQTGDMELRLEADGTALFTYFSGIGVQLSTEGAECNDAPGNAWAGTYDAAAGTFEIPPVSDVFEFWDVSGSFDDVSAYGPMGYEYKTAIGDNYLVDNIVISFDLPLVP